MAARPQNCRRVWLHPPARLRRQTLKGNHGTAIHRAPFEVKAVQEDGTFEGYGSIFGNVDSYKEIVAAGAFAESLMQWKESGRLPPVLWQHRSGEPIGLRGNGRGRRRPEGQGPAAGG